jgi:hypothetical protein
MVQCLAPLGYVEKGECTSHRSVVHFLAGCILFILVVLSRVRTAVLQALPPCESASLCCYGRLVQLVVDPIRMQPNHGPPRARL